MLRHLSDAVAIHKEDIEALEQYLDQDGEPKNLLEAHYEDQARERLHYTIGRMTANRVLFWCIQAGDFDEEA